MKKFRFRYDKILQLRLDQENDIKNKLAKINQKILEEEDQLEAIKNQSSVFLENVEKQMTEGVAIGELRDIAHNKSYLHRMTEKSKRTLKMYVEERIQIQKELIEANKERKVMEKLKEKEVETYKDLEEMEEKQIIDQIVTYQSTKKRGEK